MSESCRAFSRAGSAPLLGQLHLSRCLPPLVSRSRHFLILVPPVVFAATCSGWGSPALGPRAQRSWEQELGVVAESLGCVSRTSFMGGERANFRLSPPLFPAPLLDWLTFWEIHLPLTLRSRGCHLVEDLEARALKGSSSPLRLFQQSGVEVARGHHSLTLMKGIRSPLPHSNLARR